MALTDQVLMPGSDYQAICDATRALTGSTATLKSGEVASAITDAKKETWVLNIPFTPPSESSEITFSVNFESNSKSFTSMVIDPDHLVYKNASETFIVCVNCEDWNQYGPMYRKIVISGSYSNDFKTWLEANAVKHENNLAIGTGDYLATYPQDNFRPTPPYDAVSSLKVTVPIEKKQVNLNMASGNQIIKKSIDAFLSQVTITKPATLVPENIKSGVNIGGVVGTMEAGASGFAVMQGSFTLDQDGSGTVISLPYETTDTTNCALLIIKQRNLTNVSDYMIQELWAFNPSVTPDPFTDPLELNNTITYCYVGGLKRGFSSASTDFSRGDDTIDISFSNNLRFAGNGDTTYDWWVYNVPQLEI